MSWIFEDVPNYVNRLVGLRDMSKAKLQLQLLEDLVDIHLVEKFFERGAWILLQSKMAELYKVDHLCNLCQLSLRLHTYSIECDHCLILFHMKCVRRNNDEPKQRF